MTAFKTTLEQDAETVKAVLAKHIQTPDARGDNAARGEADARSLMAVLPADLTERSLGAWMDARGMDGGKHYRREFRKAAVLLRMGAR
jgi:hypothetical protein